MRATKYPFRAMLCHEGEADVVDAPGATRKSADIEVENANQRQYPHFSGRKAKRPALFASREGRLVTYLNRVAVACQVRHGRRDGPASCQRIAPSLKSHYDSRQPKPRTHTALECEPWLEALFTPPHTAKAPSSISQRAVGTDSARISFSCTYTSSSRQLLGNFTGTDGTSVLRRFPWL